MEERLDEAIEHLKQLIKESQRPASETLLDDGEVMKLLRVCKRTLASLRAEGIIPYSKLGKKIIYTLADILAVVDKNKVANSNFQSRILHK
jgi:hypothetical protein